MMGVNNITASEKVFLSYIYHKYIGMMWVNNITASENCVVS